MPRFSPTLSLYIGAQFLLAFVSLLGALGGLILLFDTIELMRRSVGIDTLSFATLFGMAILKMPHTVQATLPFIIMMAMMYALFRLSRSYELIVIRSAGMSVWQFLAPPFLLAGVIGLLNLFALDPVAAAGYNMYQRLERDLILRSPTTLDVGRAGLWLRESQNGETKVVHATTVRQEGDVLNLTGVSVFLTTGEAKLARRLEAEKGQLLVGAIKLDNAWDMSPPKEPVHHDEYFLNTALTIEQVQDSFASPESMSFWELPDFIRNSRLSGFAALPHRLYWQSLLASPLLLCAMILMASAFYLTAHARLAGWTARGVAGIGTAFVFYFFSRFTYALGLSATLPLILAAWAPTMVAMLLGLAYLFHREDG